MRYLDPSLTRHARLSSVQGPALCLPLNEREDAFFVTGTDDSWACFLSGRYIGQAMLTREASRYHVLAIEGVSVEVDVDSAMDPNVTGKRRLTIVRQAAGMGVMVNSSERQPPQMIIAPIILGATLESSNERIAFSRWRIVHGSGENKIELWAVDADAPGPTS